MQDETLNKEIIKTQPPSEIIQPELKKKKNKLSIIIVVSILILIAIIFNESEFISFFIVLSIPVVIIYLTSRNTYKEVLLYKMITRPTFYLLLFVLDVIIFFVIIASYGPGLGLLPISMFIILGEIILNILAIISYELILKYKIKTGKLN